MEQTKERTVPSGSQKSRFKIIKLEDRIAPSNGAINDCISVDGEGRHIVTNEKSGVLHNLHGGCDKHLT